MNKEYLILFKINSKKEYFKRKKSNFIERKLIYLGNLFKEILY